MKEGWIWIASQHAQVVAFCILLSAGMLISTEIFSNQPCIGIETLMNGGSSSLHFSDPLWASMFSLYTQKYAHYLEMAMPVWHDLAILAPWIIQLESPHIP